MLASNYIAPECALWGMGAIYVMCILFCIALHIVLQYCFAYCAYILICKHAYFEKKILSVSQGIFSPFSSVKWEKKMRDPTMRAGRQMALRKIAGRGYIFKSLPPAMSLRENASRSSK